MNTGALPIGTILRSPVESYRVEAVLGHGGFGITYKVSTEKVVKIGHVSQSVLLYFAVKEFFPKGCDRAGDGATMTFASTIASEVKQSLADFITEAQRLYKLDALSRHIVKVNEVFEANGTAYYVMEYLDGGNVEDYVQQHGALTWAEAQRILTPIAEAVSQLHKEGLLHMDIKPDNIVFKRTPYGQSIPVLIDFGIAKHFDSSGHPTSHLSAKGASDGYAPIEQYTEITSFAPNIDIYALGATLYFMLTAQRPPKAFDVRSVNDLVSQLPPATSPAAIAVLEVAMQPNYFNRLNDIQSLVRMFKEGESAAPTNDLGAEENETKKFHHEAKKKEAHSLTKKPDTETSRKTRKTILLILLAVAAVILLLVIVPRGCNTEDQSQGSAVGDTTATATTVPTASPATDENTSSKDQDVAPTADTTTTKAATKTKEASNTVTNNKSTKAKSASTTKTSSKTSTNKKGEMKDQAMPSTSSLQGSNKISTRSAISRDDKEELMEELKTY